MSQPCGTSLNWPFTRLKQLLLFSALFLLILLAISYHTMSRSINKPRAIATLHVMCDYRNASPKRCLDGHEVGRLDKEVKLSPMQHASAATATSNIAVRIKPGNTTSHHPNSFNSGNRTSEIEFVRRRSLIEDICTTTNSLPGSVQGVFTYHKSGVIYCLVPKCGCTFWKRVFNFLTNEKFSSSFKSPFEIPRLAVHSFSNSNGEPYNKVNHHPENYPVRLIVARDPISRMISSYLDKIYLPDFWQNIGIPFMSLSKGLRQSQELIKRQFDHSNIFSDKNRFRFKGRFAAKTVLKKEMKPKTSDPVFHKHEDDFLRKHFDELSVMFNTSFDTKRSSTSDHASCGKYVTFSDFVTGSLFYPEPHWTPVYQLCNPCQFLPTHIGSMETFTADARVILSEMGLEHILDNFDSMTQINEELIMIVDYHFTLVFKSNMRSFYSACVTTKELAVRLWNIFQWQGYIHPQVEYRIPAYSDVDEVQADLMTQIWRAREIGLRHPEDMKKMKKDFARKLISTLSENVLEEFLWKFRLDYEMFRYEKIKRDDCGENQ